MSKWITNPEDAVKGHLYWGNIEDDFDSFESVLCCKYMSGDWRVFESPQAFIAGNYCHMFSDSRILLKDMGPDLPTINGESVEPGYYLAKGIASLTIFHLDFGDSWDTEGVSVQKVDEKYYAILEDIWDKNNKEEDDV